MTTGTIMVTDTMPTGLTFVSGTGTGWSCSAVGQLATCTAQSDTPPILKKTGGGTVVGLTVIGPYERQLLNTP